MIVVLKKAEIEIKRSSAGEFSSHDDHCEDRSSGSEMHPDLIQRTCSFKPWRKAIGFDDISADSVEPYHGQFRCDCPAMSEESRGHPQLRLI